MSRPPPVFALGAAICLGFFMACTMPGGCTGGPARDASHGLCRDCNVVLISVDTLRADHVGAYGCRRPTTPVIDSLAARSVLFENAIAQSSWTRPAHMSILTGLHPREHGFVALADTRRLDESIPTLATVLQGAGYVTAAFVGGVNLSASFGFDRGFDTYRSSGKYFHDNLEDTRDWLDHRRPGKFFLLLQAYDPHAPYLNDAVDRQTLGLPPAPPAESHGSVCRSDGPVSRIEPYADEYAAAVHRADRYVGKLVRELEERDLLERTILIVLSDHGEEFLEHGRCFHIATLYREVLHVPLLVAAPGLAPRRVAPVVSASVTIPATVMDLLGIGPHPFPGPSLLTAALGGPVPDDPVVSETGRSRTRRGEIHLRALTTDRDKLIHWTTSDRYALFDAKTDPGEQAALDRKHTEDRHAELAGLLERWVAAHPPRTASRREQKKGTAGGPHGGGDPELERRAEELRSFGYVE